METSLINIEWFGKFSYKGEIYYVKPNQQRLKVTFCIKRQGGAVISLPNETIVKL